MLVTFFFLISVLLFKIIYFSFSHHFKAFKNKLTIFIGVTAPLFVSLKELKLDSENNIAYVYFHKNFL